MKMSLKNLYKQIREEKLPEKFAPWGAVSDKQFVDKFGKLHKKGDRVDGKYYHSLPDKDKLNFNLLGRYGDVIKKDDDDKNKDDDYYSTKSNTSNYTNPSDSSFGGGSFGGGGAGSDW